MPRARSNSHPSINGFINFYKPPNITSMEALRQIKRITGQRNKVGHGGTMDPLAKGVLPVCFGQATRLMDYLVEGTKEYLLEVKLGVTTTTYDAEGEVVKSGDTSHVNLALIEDALPQFIGAIQQTPPMYSAVKVQGQRLYKLARAGVEVEREARTVDIYNIRIVAFSLPLLTLDVECGRGVYMRSLAHDLGEMLGCGGYVTQLERLQVGGFRAEEGVTLEQLEKANQSNPAGWQQYLYPVDWALRSLRSLSVNQVAAERLRHGQAVSLGRNPAQATYLEHFRAYGPDGHFLALVRYELPTNSWRPVKVFQLDTPSSYAPLSEPVKLPDESIIT